MNRMLMALVGVSFATVVATADDPPKLTPAAKLAAIQKEAKEAETKLYKTLDDLGESKEAQKKAEELFKGFEKEQTKWCAAALELAKADPKSAVAFDALEWVVQRQVDSKEIGGTALVLMTEHHAANPKIGLAVYNLALFRRYAEDPKNAPGDALLKAVAEQNKDKTVRGHVALARAWEAKRQYEDAEDQKQKNAEELATVAERAFEELVKEYGECKVLETHRISDQTIGGLAKVELFELRNLRVGKPAPDIEGEDLDGVKFKLSDYKGKVILLDFWGDW